jgi:predicted phage terminase large subunit-like protein
MNLYEPQTGPQTDFHACSADIVIYGGGAGGGKTYAVLGEPFYHYDNPKFGAVIFRKTNKEIENVGGLYSKSEEMYLPANGRPSGLSWYFPSGAHVQLSGMEHDKDRFHWQGTDIDLIEWDELTHFSATQFWYVTLSRGRSRGLATPYTRATCNPDPDSFVRQLIDWWIGPDGYPIPARAGKVRAFMRHSDDSLEWFNSKKEAFKKYGTGPEVRPLTLAFIPAKVTDNKILMARDPGYYANLMAMPFVDRERLLRGNWNVRPQPGNFFKREWFEIIDAIPAQWKRQVRFWDTAATKPSVTNHDPDWTRGLKIASYPDGTFLVVDMRSARDTPRNIDVLMKNTAIQDGYGCLQMRQQDPGSAGKAEIENFNKLMAGFQYKSLIFSRDKQTRAKAASSAAEAKTIKVLRGPWNEDFFRELENFPGGAHDDIVDCLSGGYNELTGSPGMTADMVERMGRVMGFGK